MAKEKDQRPTKYYKEN